MERKLLGTQLRGLPCAQTHQVFHAPFPEQERSSICRGMGWMGRGCSQWRRQSLKEPVQKTDPALKHPLVIFEFHLILPKQTGCRAQNTPEDVAKDPWSTESHGCVQVFVSQLKKCQLLRSSQRREFFILALFLRGLK